MDKPYFITWSRQRTADTIAIQSASDVYFNLEDGKKIVDFCSTSFQASFGHSNKPIIDKIKQQLLKMPTAFPKSTSQQKQNISERLLQFMGVGTGKLFYTTSGTESLENALKISREQRQAQLVCAREKSFHGATLGSLSITGDWRNKAHETIDQWTLRIPEPANDPGFKKAQTLIEKAGPKNIAAICLETITGANGVTLPDQQWYEGVSHCCQKFGIHLILDEVTCGFGRTGSGFAFQEYGLKPDMIVTSKAISGGYIPFGALWVNEQLSRAYDDRVLACGLTNYAHPLGLAALEGVLDQLEDPEFKRQKECLQKTFHDELDTLKSSELVKHIRYKGMLAAIELKATTQCEWMDFIQQGIHLICRDQHLILAPPFVMPRELLQGTMRDMTSVIRKSA